MRLYQVKMPHEVRKIIKDSFGPLGSESIDITKAGTRVCAEEVTSPEDVPGFDRSTVDGYALKAADTFGASESLPAMLSYAGAVVMGHSAGNLPANDSCIYVPTGGMLPRGADAVVMIEDTELLGDILNCFRQAAPGENVIKRGEDIAQGISIIKKGKKLRSADVGLLASLGMARIKVAKKPLIGIVSTGDEVVPYTTENLQPAQVRDCNAPALAVLAAAKGADTIYAGVFSDDYDSLKKNMMELLQQVDFLLLSGGSSVGKRDYTAQVLTEISDNKRLLVEGIGIQPGKPTLLAKCQGKPILGLPGHPISALNIFSLFGTYIIDCLQGFDDEGLSPSVKALLTRNAPSRAGRIEYIRVKLEKAGDKYEATPVFGRSGLLRTMADSHGVIIVPAVSEGLLAGKEVEVYLFE